MRTRKPITRSLQAFSTSALLTGATVLSASAQAGMNLASAPLFLSDSVEPNIIFTLDDSGSMHWETMPDSGVTFNEEFADNSQDHQNAVMWTFPPQSGVFGAADFFDVFLPPPYTAPFEGEWAAYFRDPQINDQYYNPGTTYAPWLAPKDGTPMPAAPPEAAPHHPRMDLGTRDLTEMNTVGDGEHENSDNVRWAGDKPAGDTFFPAVYYYNGERREIIPDEAPFAGEGRSGRADCDGTDSCTYDEEIQNFANWYTYHRNRIFAARAGIGRAFFGQDENIRVGYGTINNPYDPNNPILPLAPFDADAQTSFLEALYDQAIPGEDPTPLRQATWDTGKYFENNSEPYEDAQGEERACRRNYHILMTDGYWNESVTTDQNITNNTAQAGPEHERADDDTETYGYSAVPPFEATYSTGRSEPTLAEIALHFWERDLRDADNNVPADAFWHHVTMIGVGLGVQGAVPPNAAIWAMNNYSDLADYDDFSFLLDNQDTEYTDEDIAWLEGGFEWPDPLPVGDSTPAKIDDLLHASIITRGGFFSAADAPELSQRIAGIRESVADDASRAAAATATNTRFAAEGARTYQARLDSSDWSGDLLAFGLDEETGEVLTPGQPEWRASDVMATQWSDPAAGRNILTWDGDTGTTFDEDGLTGDMWDDLNNDADLLAYLRGADANENQRERSSLIGAISNSDPTFVGTHSMGYGILSGEEGQNYRAWRRSDDYRSRSEMVYVGSNAGMLHGINADTGEEAFAFIPREMISRLPALADPNSSHQFLVDGTPVAGDAYLGSDTCRTDEGWCSVVVGTPGLGGRSIFALNVTDPDRFGQEHVLWEFAHEELGYGVDDARIVRLSGGQWAAVFGNGYNSDGLGSSLFIVPLDSTDPENDYVHIQAGDGDADNPNGMGPPVAADANRDGTADSFYAGDLHGNLWRFDAEEGMPSNATRIFETNNNEPITARPVIGDNPDGDGVMVYFGTGKLLERGDGIVTADTPVQSLYGLMDDGGRNNIGQLLVQSIDRQTEDDGFRTREFTANEHNVNTADNGWRLDLDDGENTRGERVITPARVMGNRIRFATFKPNDDPCAFGGDNWIIELDAGSGAHLQQPTLDITGDGDWDASSFMVITGAPIDISRGGVSLEGGNENQDSDPDEEEGDWRGEGPATAREYGRQSWRELLQ